MSLLLALGRLKKANDPRMSSPHEGRFACRTPESSIQSSIALTWSGKPAPLDFLHKQLDCDPNSKS